MVTSFDNEYLFTADKDGLLVKSHIKIPIARVSNDLRIENGIWSMCVTKNSKFLVTGGLGEINVLSIYPKKILMNLQRVELAGVGRISILEMTSDDQNT